MNTPQTSVGPSSTRTRLSVSWLTVGLLVILIAYADGFWVTSLQGTVGAIELSQEPFSRWLRESTIMVPFVFLGVLAALAIARRLVGGHRRSIVRLGVSALLIVVVGTAVCAAELGVSSAYSYHLQSRQLEQLHSAHAVAAPTTVERFDSSPAGKCLGLCIAKRLTVQTHVRALKYGGLVMLITNFVLVGWALALRGGRLWVPRASKVDQTDEPINRGALAGSLA